MKNKDTKAEFEEPPGHRRPPHSWGDVSPTPKEVAGLSPSGLFRVDITSYFANFMAPDDLNCPIRRQTVPIAHELVPFEAKMTDSPAEDVYFSVLGLVHRYPDWVPMLVTTQCANHCRFLVHSRIVGNRHAQFNTADYKEIPISMILNTEGKQ